jgi:uncharacterized Zn-binding protein involved in type VI secretion
MPPAARITDMHTCPLVTGTVPHVGGPITVGAPTVRIGMLPAARLGDPLICAGPPDTIAKGSISVIIAGQPAARLGDMTAHGGVISVGFPTVLIGDVGAGPGGLPVVRLPDGRLQVGSNIIIDGTPAFQAQVMNRLALIASTPSGRQLLANINSRPHTMTITEFTGPNSFAGADSWADATPAGQPVFNGAGNPVNSWWGLGPQETGTGNGSDVSVQFNPNLTLPNSSAPGNPMPNDAILFHEMDHGDHQMGGTFDGTPAPGWTTNEERNTITGPGSEETYLRERGYPWKRNSHGTTFVPNP